MTVTVKLFAAAREMIGSEEVKLELPEGATVGDAKRVLTERYPQIAGLLSRSVMARNQEYALDVDVVAASDELAVIPPVSGG
ncbi:MAG TPA: molybdopterin converting factor subunit 1 [Gemmata sp.]|jgi:molybdopterin converting factor subunit 1|nr:molybdopterin converting factor subunit 1 [Gemmata sp.]